MTDVRTPPGDEAGEDARPDEGDGDPAVTEPDAEEAHRPKSKGLVLAIVHGLTVVGEHRGGVLNPVYEFKPQIAQTPQGLQVSHICLPLMMLASMKSLRIPPGAIVQPVDELSKADRDQVFRAVAQGEDMAKGLRMAQAGVVSPAAGAIAAMRAGMNPGPGGRRG